MGLKFYPLLTEKSVPSRSSKLDLFVASLSLQKLYCDSVSIGESAMMTQFTYFTFSLTLLRAADG